MSNLARQAKYFYWKWKKEGANNRESDSYRKMRDIKKCLRSEQRKLEAQKRNNRMTEIMEPYSEKMLRSANLGHGSL
jgi:hypothetical protein